MYKKNLFGLLIMLVSVSYASNKSSINVQISNTAAALQQLQKNHRNVEKTLKEIDLEVSRVSRTLNLVTHRLMLAQENLVRLHSNTQQCWRQYQIQYARLADQIKATYMLSRQNYLKVLLVQESPQEVDRQLAYYRYYNQARLTLIRPLQENLKRLASLEQQAHQQTKQLGELQHFYQQQQVMLLRTKQRRQALVSYLDSQEKTSAQHLAKLEKDKQALEKVVVNAIHGRSSFMRMGVPIAIMRGKLPWPTRGNLVQVFGGETDIPGVRSNAVIIRGVEGQKIYSLYAGRVIFAGWLRGMGLLLILDHGNGYMSLYGHNQDLYHRVGDWVSSGELIATMGESGGSNQSGLYFSIRHNGKAINPAQWCR